MVSPAEMFRNVPKEAAAAAAVVGSSDGDSVGSGDGDSVCTTSTTVGDAVKREIVGEAVGWAVGAGVAQALHSLHISTVLQQEPS